MSEMKSKNLFQLILSKAVQPSPIKPEYSKKELEEAAINLTQYLTIDVQSSPAQHFKWSKYFSKSTLNLLLAQLSDMGFNKQCVFSAIEAHGYTSLDALVSLLMEGKNECLSDITDTLSSYEDISDRDESSVTEECPENVSFYLLSLSVYINDVIYNFMLTLFGSLQVTRKLYLKDLMILKMLIVMQNM